MPERRKPGRLLRTLAEVAEFWKAAGQVLVEGFMHTAAERQIAQLEGGRIRVWAKRVNLHFAEDVVLFLEDLAAEIEVDDPDLPLIPEKTDQYTFHLVHGRIRLGAASVEALLGKYLFPAARIPLRDPRVFIDERGMRLDAELAMGPVTVPITLAGPMQLDSDGRIELAAVRVEAARFGLGPVLGLLRTDLERVLPMAPGGPVTAAGNRMRIDPEHIFPSPRARGRPAAVHLEPGEIVLEYRSQAEPPPPPLISEEHPAYLFCLGHALLIGKMFLHDAVFQVIPQDPEAASLDFSLQDYRKQLAAGESAMKQHGELLVRLPALSDLAEAYPKLNGRLALRTQRAKIRKRQPT
ncbi:MAG: hypothetical protein FJZ01_02305 [Candidatus Sericytochromatia bacterium]|nr:hypothetical protein [Candidatus Tanganyikabacteria bacterium]